MNVGPLLTPKPTAKAKKLLLKHMEKGVRNRDVASPPVHAPDPNVANFALSYLNAFGYLKDELSQWNGITLDDITTALDQFQSTFSLPRSGNLCVQSVRAMQMPRCGCPDIPANNPNYLRMMEFVTANLARWQKTALLYSIENYLPNISKTDFEAVVDQAFQNWAQLGNIQINRATTGDADIVISTGSGPQSNFDGPGGILAWAYLPTGSDAQLLMEFDLAENWTVTPGSSGVQIANVACHEFGHLMGLSHSTMQSALMAPYYNVAIATPQSQDDIPRFVARYGTKTPGSPPVSPPLIPTPATPSLVSVVSITGQASVILNGQPLN
jgi:hypothetical protein